MLLSKAVYPNEVLLQVSMESRIQCDISYTKKSKRNGLFCSSSYYWSMPEIIVNSIICICHRIWIDREESETIYHIYRINQIKVEIKHVTVGTVRSHRKICFKKSKNYSLKNWFEIKEQLLDEKFVIVFLRKEGMKMGQQKIFTVPNP